ncbi:MAG: hypothetical protein ACSLE2_16600 [Lysobacterales bacterium]
MSNENVVSSHHLVVRFDQLEDGTVTWYATPDEQIGQTRALGLARMAECGAPLAALGIRALWKLCEDGLIYHALEEANGMRHAVERLRQGGAAEAQLALPVESAALH